MINNPTPPTPSTLEEVQVALENVRGEHVNLTKDIASAKQWLQTYEVQRKQLEDFSDFLAKEQSRVQDYEKQVQNREYVLQAETGKLGTLMTQYLDTIRKAGNGGL